MTGSTPPLAGVRVLDLSHMLAGPLATMLLADLGAEVVKIEQPQGDHTRTVGHRGAMFLAANRGKRSAVVDLRTPEGRDFALRLAARSDIVVEAFRPGVMDKLGLGLANLREVNPTVIFASLVGFGSVGPDSHRRGVDLVLQAESGIMSVTGHGDGPPTRVGFQLVDVASGLNLSQAILAALLRRERFGEPSEIEVRLFDTAVYLQCFQFAEFGLTGQLPGRTGNSAPHAAPSDLVYAADGALVVAAYFEDQWRGLCEVLELEWMIEDPRFDTPDTRIANRQAMLEVLNGQLKTQTRSYWHEHLNARGVLVGEVRTYDEIVASEQAEINQIFVESELPDGTSLRLVSLPYALSGNSVRAIPPPALGADTRSIARELGFSDEEIDDLGARAVLGGSAVPNPPAVVGD